MTDYILTILHYIALTSINFNDIPWTSIPLIFHNIPMIFHSLPMIFPYFRLFGGRTVQRRSAQLLNGFRQVTWFFMRINSYEWVWLMVMNDGYWWLWTMVWLLIMGIHGYQRLFIAIHSQSCFLMVIVRDEWWFINNQLINGSFRLHTKTISICGFKVVWHVIHVYRFEKYVDSSSISQWPRHIWCTTHIFRGFLQ